MNRGLDLEKEKRDVKPTQWVFGAASLPCIAIIPPDLRQSFLPRGEVQKGTEDFMDCASRGPLNILEAKLTYLYQTGQMNANNRWFLQKHGFIKDGKIELSDRYVAIKSGTTRNGNSLVAPMDAIHRDGCIPKSMLPADSSMDFDTYHNPASITAAMTRIGQEFALRFSINYEQVREEDFEVSLRYDFLNVAVHAWPDPKNGIYQRTDQPENHVVCVFQGVYFAFDNYLDTDLDYVKQLAPNYNFYPTGYRLFITAQRTTAEVEAELRKRLSLLQRLFALLKSLYARTA